jgi:hypothetical protein
VFSAEGENTRVLAIEAPAAGPGRARALRNNARPEARRLGAADPERDTTRSRRATCACDPAGALGRGDAGPALAWRVAKYVKSNAIVLCAGGMTLASAPGQMSRLDSARIARIKADAAGLSLAGSAVASDAFFPFRDGLDVVVEAGATAVIQPGRARSATTR